MFHQSYKEEVGSSSLSSPTHISPHERGVFCLYPKILKNPHIWSEKSVYSQWKLLNFSMLKTFIKELLNRRVPQILGSYLVAGTSLILFIEYLVDKYQFPSHYPTLSLFALFGILPSVVILSYFHGAPGKDEWTKVEKIGIPINVLFITCVLFFGDNFNMWNISDAEEDKLRQSIVNIDCTLRGFLGALKEMRRDVVRSITTAKLIDTVRDKKMAEEIVGTADNVLKYFDCIIFGDVNRDTIKKAIDGVQEILKEAKRRSYF